MTDQPAAPAPDLDAVWQWIGDGSFPVSASKRLALLALARAQATPGDVFETGTLFDPVCVQTETVAVLAGLSASTASAALRSLTEHGAARQVYYLGPPRDDNRPPTTRVGYLIADRLLAGATKTKADPKADGAPPKTKP